MIRARYLLSKHGAKAYITALVLALNGATYAGIVHQTDASQASQHQQQVAEAAAQRKAGLLVEQKLCATFNRLAANKPPAGNPEKNPSRAYDQRNHAILDELGPDLGLDCQAAHVSKRSR